MLFSRRTVYMTTIMILLCEMKSRRMLTCVSN